MSGNGEIDESTHLCHPYIVEAGFPNRDQIILRREAGMYPLSVNSLMGSGKGGYADTAEMLTVEMLEAAFDLQDATMLPDAAFLAGRCQPDEPELQDKLTLLLRNFVDSLPVDDLDIMDTAYIEAAMSLALRGDPEAARRALQPLATTYAATSPESYLAAFYLAQLGDPAGYPAMLKSLGSDNEHYRLMATRRLIGFKPYDGQTIQGKVVDVDAELIKRLGDSNSYVRVEVPYLLAEAGVEGLRELLLPVAESDPDEDVRRSARDVLDNIQG